MTFLRAIDGGAGEAISPLGCVDKALRALQRLGEAGADGMALTRLARELSLNKASLHRILSALRHRGFVEQEEGGNYRLGAAMLTLTDSYFREESLSRVLHDSLSKLCGRINETCHLGVLAGEQIMYIDKVEPPRAFRFWSEIGWRNPALCTALGRAILSQKFVDFDSFCAHFPGAISQRATTRPALTVVWQELLDARKRGFAIEEQENEPGVTCIATALLRDAEVVAAISITTRSDRIDMERAAMIISALHESFEPQLPPGLTLQKPIGGGMLRSALARPEVRGRRLQYS
jgi:DNA-binding IclR family transcriptional regulator